MIRRYLFCAPPHHEFRAGAAVCLGGQEITLDDSRVNDPRLVPLDDEPETEQTGDGSQSDSSTTQTESRNNPPEPSEVGTQENPQAVVLEEDSSAGPPRPEVKA